ncbi:MAG TPA: hypothetical protein PLI17_03170 [Denitromonas sp.]|nr:hypothetical protein [Chromatiaceae bacterium]HPR05617.1 hypothetical protein [Denitromonas sp.]
MNNVIGFDRGTTHDLTNPAESGWRAHPSDTAWTTLLHNVETAFEAGDGWDGEDADAPSEALLASVFSLLRQLQNSGSPMPSRIIPTYDGGIVVEWHYPDKYIEMEIEEPYSADVMEACVGEPADHYELTWRRPSEATDYKISESIDVQQYAMTA